MHTVNYLKVAYCEHDEAKRFLLLRPNATILRLFRPNAIILRLLRPNVTIRRFSNYSWSLFRKYDTLYVSEKSILK